MHPLYKISGLQSCSNGVGCGGWSNAAALSASAAWVSCLSSRVRVGVAWFVLGIPQCGLHCAVWPSESHENLCALSAVFNNRKRVGCLAICCYRVCSVADAACISYRFLYSSWQSADRSATFYALVFELGRWALRFSAGRHGQFVVDRAFRAP